MEPANHIFLRIVVHGDHGMIRIHSVEADFGFTLEQLEPGISETNFWNYASEFASFEIYHRPIIEREKIRLLELYGQVSDGKQ